MPNKLISVMMPAYNAEQYIEEAIESLLAQTYTHWELIVVNDGSTDRTVEIVSRFTDPRIRLIHQKNGGESAARNTALDHMNGEWLAYLDSDDAYLPNHLEVTAAYLEEHPDRDAVYTDGYHIDPDGHRMKTLSSRRRGPFEGKLFEQLITSSDVFGPPLCVVLRRQIITDHALRYDTRIVIGPDWDFFIQYSEHANFGYLDEQTCLYRVHFTNITVQINLKKRASYLAMCRENAIKRTSFLGCSVATRATVFYDLLVNQLTGLPQRQDEITRWEEFHQLPDAEQARLYRLMASEALIEGEQHPNIGQWFQQAVVFAPEDQKGRLLDRLYRVSPWACRQFLRLRRKLTGDAPRLQQPFHDLT